MINKENLDAFLKPQSIAILGVSGDLSKISGKPLKYLVNHKYKGNIFPINPKYEEIAGIKCYSKLSDIPGKIDLAIIGLPAQEVINSLKECVKKGARSAIVFGSGFAEMGGEGKVRQETLSEFTKSNNILICGPNCQGMINLHDQITSSFTSALDRVPLLSGDIAFISQSGAYGGSIFNMAQELGIGFSYWISTGNESDLTSVDLIDYMIDDEGTRVIAAYVEGFKEKDINRLSSTAKKGIERQKPIVIMKVGTSEVGKKAASSHTGSLAGSDIVFNAFCKQNGIIRVYDLEELFDTVYALSMCKLPKGDRIGILTTSGGAGVSIADKAFQLGLNIPELKGETKQELTKILPSFGSALNPVDVTGQISTRVLAKGEEGELYKKCIEIVMKDPDIDALLIMLTMVGQDRAPKVANDIVGVSKDWDKPILVSWLAGDLAKEGYRILNENHIPTFRTPDRCVMAIKKLVEYAEIVNNAKQKKDAVIDSVKVETAQVEELKAYLKVIKKRTLTEFETRRFLESYGIPMAKCINANSLDEAVTGAEEIGFPIILKINSPDILHKTEVGGIKLGIKNKVELSRSYQELINEVKIQAREAEIKGVLVEEMVNGQAEVIIGMSQDQQFGPTIMFGLGGIFVEVFKDISMRVAPISRIDAKNMIKEIKGYEILKGFRGKPRLDIESIIEILMKLSQLAIDFKDQILEIDLNPIILLEEKKGAKVVDCLIVLWNEGIENAKRFNHK